MMNFFLILLILMPLSEGVLTPYRAIIQSDLDGEIMSGGALQLVPISEMASGIDYLLYEYYTYHPGVKTIWASSGQETIQVREHYTSTCKYETYVSVNVSPGGSMDIYINGVLINSITHVVGSYFANPVYDPTFCRKNQVTFQITAPSGSDQWFWYIVQIEESEYFSCSDPCQAVCMNGVVQKTEECDDGNVESGDGCSTACTIEPGWVCPSGACFSIKDFCGNGFREFHLAREMCDDGNTIDGDGCSSQCFVEEGYYCQGTLPTICSRCGNLAVDEGEQCDDGGREDGDGCSSTCQVEPHFHCSQAVPPECQPESYCGDGNINDGEQCDDGNEQSGDGCSGTCAVEAGWECAQAEGVSKCQKVCSDGVVQAEEACDDGNVLDGDGCSSECTVEDKWTCAVDDEGKSVCEEVDLCGNGLLNPENLEECDDGNREAGDGCNQMCRIEEHYRCLTLSSRQIARSPDPKPAQSVCFLCGNGQVQLGEQCDDGNYVDLDGCSANCMLES